MSKKDVHQTLMNQAYNMIKGNSENGTINSHIDMMNHLKTLEDTKLLDAVILGNMNYQVENGGWEQWVYNGYCTTYPLVEDVLERMNTPTATKVLDMLTIVGERLSDDVLNGTMESDGCGGTYINDDYAEHYEECSVCGGDGVVDDVYDSDEDAVMDCDCCDGGGEELVEEDLNYGNLSDKYYDLNTKFMNDVEVFLGGDVC